MGIGTHITLLSGMYANSVGVIVKDDGGEYIKVVFPREGFRIETVARSNVRFTQDHEIHRYYYNN